MKRTRGSDALRSWLMGEDRSQQWLASKLGTSQTQVSAWVRGNRVPSVRHCIAIAATTGIPVVAWAETVDDVA